MTEMDTMEGVVDLVTRRIDVLQYLDGSTAGKETLVEELDISRSTVNRSLRELESAGFVTRSEGGFTASATGRTVAELYREFRTTLTEAVGAQPLLSALPPSATVSHAMIRGSDIHVSEPPTPYRPIERVTDLVTAAETFRSLSTAVARPESFDRITKAVVDDGLDAEIVFEVSVAEQIRTSRADPIREAMESDQFAMYATAELPYSLGIVRDSGTSHAFLVVSSPESELRGVVINDSAAAIAWAEKVYRNHRAAATELPPPETRDDADGHYT